jgi:hypothetical protein
MRHVGGQGSLWGDLRERDHMEDLGEGGRIILKYIFKKWDGEYVFIF